MIYMPIIIAWIVLIALVILMWYVLGLNIPERIFGASSFDEQENPWMYSWVITPQKIVWFIIVMTFGVIIFSIYETFIHNKLPQKPQGVSVKQENAKSPTPQKLSKEEQIVQKTLQKQ